MSAENKETQRKRVSLGFSCRVPARTRTEDIQNHKRRAKIFANPLPVSVCVFSENAFCGNFLSFSAKISVFRVRFWF